MNQENIPLCSVSDSIHNNEITHQQHHRPQNYQAINPSTMVTTTTTTTATTTTIPIDKSIKNQYPPFQRQDKWTVYEVCKCVLIGYFFLVPIRTILLVLIAILWFLYSRLIVFTEWYYWITRTPMKTIDDFRPHSIRRRMFSVLRTMTRIGLWICGFYRIHRLHIDSAEMNSIRYPISVQFSENSTGRICLSIQERNLDQIEVKIEQAEQPMQQQPIQQQQQQDTCFTTVFNHVSFVDAFIVLQEFAPICILAKGSLKKVPLFGGEMQYMNCLFYNNKTKSTLLDMMKQREQAFNIDNTRSKLVIFPEGTTTNSKYLLKFHRGAFVNGSPVQPVMLHYPYKHFSLAWDSISLLRWWTSMTSQFSNRATMIFFPPYYPSEYEKRNPGIFAENVRQLMCNGFNRMIPEHHMQLSDCFFTRIVPSPPTITQKQEQQVQMGSVA
jgi:1-acyl-sn-glycerol-3-phosphate acyltransferase